MLAQPVERFRQQRVAARRQGCRPTDRGSPPCASRRPGRSRPGAPYRRSFIVFDSSVRSTYCFLQSSLVRRPAAADVEHRAGRERIFLGREPGGERRQLLDLQEAAARDLRQHPVEVRLRHLVEDARLGRRRRDAVDRDVLAGELLAERLRQRDDAGLGGAVGRGVGVAFLAGDRRDRDDAAVASARASPERSRGSSRTRSCRSTSMTRRQSSGGYSQVLWLGPVMPALATRMSMPPNAVDGLRCRRIDLRPASATSTVGDVHRAPVADSSRAVRRSELRVESHSATVAPDARNRSAIARPNPCAAPVTTARRPDRSNRSTTSSLSALTRARHALLMRLPRHACPRQPSRKSRSAPLSACCTCCTYICT